MNESAPILGISRHRIPTDGDGVTSLVAFCHCPLRCRYCLNPHCFDANNALSTMTPIQLEETVRIDDLYFQATGGGITFGGGEPSLRSSFIESFRRLIGRKWHINIETSLNVDSSHIACLAPIIDAWYIDVKDMNPDVYMAYTGVNNHHVIQNLKFLAAQGLQDRCTIRLPLIPDFNDDSRRDASQKILEEMGFTKFDRFRYRTQK